MHRPITPQPQPQQSAASDHEDYVPRTGSPARSNTSTPRAISPMTSLMGREAIHNSITALNLGGNLPVRRAASPLPISRLASSSPSPSSSTDSTSRGAHEKSLSMTSSVPRNPRRSSSPLINEATGSLRARQAPVVCSILRSRSPDPSTSKVLNGNESPNQVLGGSSLSSDTSPQYLSRVLSLDRGQASRPPPLQDSPSIDRSLEWTGHYSTSARSVSPSPLSGFGRAAQQAQQHSPPQSATARSFNESLLGREPPSASSLGAAMRSASPVNGSTSFPHHSPFAHHAPNSSTGSSFFLYDQDRDPPSRRGSASPAPSPARSRARTASPTALFSQTTRGLMFSPMLNSSCSSLASVGSSFHSLEEPEAGSLQCLYDYEGSQRAANQSASASGTSVGSDPTLVGSDDNAEEILLKFTGLTKVEIAAIHARLVDVAISKPRRGSSLAESSAAKDHTIAKADPLSEQADTVVSFR
jgi:serine/arginine repetitive matrix protein 2